MVWIDNSRILAALAVVILHVSLNGVTHIGDMDTLSWWISNFYESIVMWCVPVFIMISGALLLDVGKDEPLLIFYRKRISRVLIPILFWSIFYALWALLKKIVKGDMSYLHFTGIKEILVGVRDHHLWFLYMIIGLYIFTPFLRKITNHSTSRGLMIFVAALFLISCIEFAYAALYVGNFTVLHKWFILYLPYFIVGHLIHHAGKVVPKSVLITVFILTVVVTSIGCYLLSKSSGLSRGAYFHSYLSITVIPMSISAMFYLREISTPILTRELTRKAAQLVFGVYLIHPLFVDILIYCHLGPSSLHPALSIPLLTSVAFVLSFGVAWIIYPIPFIRRTIGI